MLLRQPKVPPPPLCCKWKCHPLRQNELMVNWQVKMSSPVALWVSSGVKFHFLFLMFRMVTLFFTKTLFFLSRKAHISYYNFCVPVTYPYYIKGVTRHRGRGEGSCPGRHLKGRTLKTEMKGNTNGGKLLVYNYGLRPILHYKAKYIRIRYCKSNIF